MHSLTQVLCFTDWYSVYIYTSEVKAEPNAEWTLKQLASSDAFY